MKTDSPAKAELDVGQQDIEVPAVKIPIESTDTAKDASDVEVDLCRVQNNVTVPEENGDLPEAKESSDTFQPTPHYLSAAADIRQAIEDVDKVRTSATSWESFPYPLGRGIKARLESLATLHVSPNAAAIPTAVKNLNANTNKVILGAPPHCELYQEKLIRALAAHIGCSLLVTDLAVLKLDVDNEEKDGSPSALDTLVDTAGSLFDMLSDSEDEDMDATPRAHPRNYSKRSKRPGLMFTMVSGIKDNDGPTNKADDRRMGNIPEMGKLLKERTESLEKKANELKSTADKVTKLMRTRDNIKKTLPGAEAAGKVSKAVAVEAKAKTDIDNAKQVLSSKADAATEEEKGLGGEEEEEVLAAETAEATNTAVPNRVLHVGDAVVYLGTTNDNVSEILRANKGTGGHLMQSKMKLREILTMRQVSQADEDTSHGDKPRKQASDAPPIGTVGKIMSIFGSRAVVEADKRYNIGGADFRDHSLCNHTSEAKTVFYCRLSDLRLAEVGEDCLVSSLRAMFDVIKEVCEGDVTAGKPLVVFVPNVDRLFRSHAIEHFKKFQDLLKTLPSNCMFIGAYCARSLAREQKGSSGGGGGSGGMGMVLFGGGGGGGNDDLPSFLADRGRSHGRRGLKSRLLTRLLPAHIELYPPNDPALMKAWKSMIESDAATIRNKTNKMVLKRTLDRCGLACSGLHEVALTADLYTRKEIEQLVGLSVAAQLKEEGFCVASDTASAAWDINSRHIVAASNAIKLITTESEPQSDRSNAVKELASGCDNYEKQLLGDVISPNEIQVSFQDIGALDSVKKSLEEVIILPLRRPELFTRGALTRPTKGLLLFGPPGTGKTMFAKAVASESGAHFINVNMSSLTSKWHGESESLVKAAFSLAHKLAPSVLFIDEIDSFLSKRGQSTNEHEAMRKMKNEFFQHWDGLRTSANERVLVLGATNRPMDLDEAVIRRMPRRILVPLPDAAAREQILKVLLKDEIIEPGFDTAEVAQITEKYSGSDLKNLAIAAAYYPIRNFLDAEKEKGGAHGCAEGDQHVQLRPITVSDFKAAMKQVPASTADETVTMEELKRWNDQYGEGGTRRHDPLAYYT